MTTIAEALAKFRDDPTSPEGRSANPFRLVSTFGEPATEHEVNAAWPQNQLPRSVVELWRNCREARLFEDQDYGQWGLIMLSPDTSARRTAQEQGERASDYRGDDIVLGEFLGDQELLVFAPSGERNRRILVALPLDDRADWFGVADDLGEFLGRYYATGGEKYWEPKQI